MAGQWPSTDWAGWPGASSPGACLEDVNHEVYGGLYSQMVFGESFQEPPTPPGQPHSTMDFILNVFPDNFVGAFARGELLQEDRSAAEELGRSGAKNGRLDGDRSGVARARGDRCRDLHRAIRQRDGI